MLTQRLGSGTQKNPAFIDSLIAEIERHPGCCDEVWLATDYGFPKMEVHRQSAETLKGVAEKFRRLGIRVSLQLSNSIGHGQYMSARDCSGLVYEGTKAEKMVGHDGTTADYCFCWNGKVFRQYALEQIRVYAEAIQPACVWIDDDLRAENHNPVSRGCFCDGCIARFNALHGANFDREGLVQAINEDTEWRRKHVNFTRNGLYDFTFEVSKAVHEVSPESRMGYQYGPYGGYTGFGYSHIFDAMRDATGFVPGSRPGGGAYSDHNPNDFVRKGFTLAWTNEMLPDYVTEIRPEIENLPDVVYGKSIAGTCFETSLYMAMGSTAMSYAMLMNDYEPMAWHGKMLKAFSERRDYWKRLSALNLSSRPAGVRMFMPREGWTLPPKPGDAPFAWTREPESAANMLLRCGVPLARSAKEERAVLLHGDAADLLSDAEIEYLLGKPVFTDGKSLEILQQRGWGKHFSARAVPCATGQLYEKMLPHPVNGTPNKPTWSQNFYITNGHFLEDVTGETAFFGEYATSSLNAPKNTNDPEHPYGMSCGIVKTDRGASWAVFGSVPWNDCISHDRRTQLLNAMDFISDGGLAARLETPWQAIVLPRADAEGRTSAVSLVNCTIGESDELTLRIRRPAGAKFTWQTATAKAENLAAANDGDDLLVTLPPMAPWSVGTLFIE